jgi:hypothetical protein
MNRHEIWERVKEFFGASGVSSPPAHESQGETRGLRGSDITGGGHASRGGRVSVDDPNQMFASAFSFFAPLSNDAYWQPQSLGARTFDRVSPIKLVELLADFSPDVSRALWDFILLCCPGFEAKAFKPGTETVDKAAQAALDAFLNSLHGPYAVPNVVPAKVVIGSLFMQAFLRGAVCAELVLDGAGRMPLEIATPDPAYIDFKRIPDEERISVWQIGQWQWGQFVPLNRPTFSYIPLHPFPGNPRGRAMAMPAIFSTLFLIGLLHDLRRVIAQQGYPRHDIAVKLENLLSAMPEEDRQDAEQIREWINTAIKEIEDVYGNLKPDQAYVHTDVVEMKDPKGVIDSKSLGAVDGIITGLERMAMRGLKTFSVMFGINEGTSETHANRQWEIMAAGIKSVQQLVETLLEALLGLALQVQGILATVEFRCAELRAAELLRDAQVEFIQANIAAFQYAQGWINQDDAARKGAGVDKADQSEPRAATGSLGAGSMVGLQADPGSQRARANGHKTSFNDELFALIAKHTNAGTLQANGLH